jgi:hypothetical protein
MKSVTYRLLNGSFWIITILLGACSTKDSSKQTPERAALTFSATPVYQDSSTYKTRKYFTLLPALATVYIGDDSLHMGGQYFMKVTWGDSTGYAPASLLARQGKIAMVTGALSGPVTVYGDKELTKPNGSMLNSWEVVVGKDMGSTFQMMAYMGLPLQGYVPAASISLDPLDFEFFNKLNDALLSYQVGSGAARDALSKDNKYAGLAAYKKYFDQTPAPPISDAYSFENDDKSRVDVSGDMTEPEINKFLKNLPWTDSNDLDLDVGDIPGTVNTYFVGEDGTEIPAGDLSLGNAHAIGPGINMNVKSVRVEVVPKIKADIRFYVQTLCLAAGGSNIEFGQTFINAEPGKSYSVLIEDTAENKMILCSLMRITIRTTYGKTVTTVNADCGD